MRLLVTSFWLVTLALAVAAFGYVLMAIDGYDYWSPFYPEPGSLADAGLSLADLGQLLTLFLMIAAWIGISVWALRVRSRIPVVWKHSKAGVWLWWLVPVASFWKPRDVYLELARASKPGNPERAKITIDRWWIWFVVFLLANYLGLIELGPAYLAATAVLVVPPAAMASFYGGKMLAAVSTPQVTYESTRYEGAAPAPNQPVAPTAPGWYNDPSGRAEYQAYWDGGQWTGATRPDPRLFPSHSEWVEKDRMRLALIILGIVVTFALMLYFIVAELEFTLDAIPAAI